MTATLTHPPLPARLVALRDEVRDRAHKADLARRIELEEQRRGAWQCLLSAAGMALPAELLKQLPAAIPDDFDAELFFVALFKFAGHWPLAVRFAEDENGVWSVLAWGNDGRHGLVSDPLGRGEPLVFQVVRPCPVVCPDLGSALDAAEIGGAAPHEDDGGDTF